MGLQQSAQPWQVHCPKRYETVFAEVSDRLYADAQFDLTTSLRTHRAEAVQEWINQLLSGNPASAAAIMPGLWESGFRVYLTRDLDVAKQYCRDRYGDQPDKRYGMVASSRAKNLTDHGVANDYKSTLRVKAGPWYIDPPDLRSCCALDQVVTEFGCQGLELNMAIVAWGNDLVWQDPARICTTRQRHVQDPRRLRLNSYRVLLSRGRNGVECLYRPNLIWMLRQLSYSKRVWLSCRSATVQTSNTIAINHGYRSKICKGAAVRLGQNV